jgi:hypothetical protein
VPARVGVERRFAHQAVDAGLGAQRAVGIASGQLDRRALDAGDLAGRLVEQLGLEALALRIAQVHALKHAGPVLRLGAAGAGLDFDEAVVRVERIAEHPLEFEFRDFPAEPGGIRFDRQQRRVVVIGARHLEQLLRVAQTAAQALHPPDDVVEQLLLPAEFLRLLRVVPDVRVFEFARNLLQSLRLGIDVKDTSTARPCER